MDLSRVFLLTRPYFSSSRPSRIGVLAPGAPPGHSPCIWFTLLACGSGAPLFEAQQVDLRLPEHTTLVAGLDRQALSQDPLLSPAALALDHAIEDARLEAVSDRALLACWSKGCFLTLDGQLHSWKREDALGARPGQLTWTLGPSTKRQLVQQEDGTFLLGDRTALVHTRERVPLLPALTGEDMVPPGPLWLYTEDLSLALNHIDRRLARAPSADARRLRLALAELEPALQAGELQIRSLGLSLSPEDQGLRLRLRLSCPKHGDARRLAAALRLVVLTLRQGLEPEQSAALARVPIQAHGRRVDVDLPSLQDLGLLLEPGLR